MRRLCHKRLAARKNATSDSKIMGHEVLIIFKQGFFMQPLLNSTSSNQTWPENAGTPAKKKGSKHGQT
jgi:hypothetical protein